MHRAMPSGARLMVVEVARASRQLRRASPHLESLRISLCWLSIHPAARVTRPESDYGYTSLCGAACARPDASMARLGDTLRQLFFRWVLDLPLERAQQAGLRLLKENLSPGQRHQLELLNFFDVVGGDTGAHYRIHFDNRMNIEQIDASGKIVVKLCLVPKEHLPVGDTVLAQKLALELFETEALRVAARIPPLQLSCLPREFRY
jgi:hypothetical protein